MHVVVVGGGIAGLAAAHELADRPGVTATVVEASPRLGGKVRTEAFAGGRLDAGPDAFLARRPEAVELCAELGLTDRLEPPATGAAWLWARGRLRRLPTGTLLGVPTDVRAVARTGILSPAGLARLAAGPLLARRGRALGPGDAAIGEVLRARLGDQAHERLVDPLVGGINAGDTDSLSIDAVAPQIAAAARRSADVAAGARALLPAPAASGGAGGAVPAPVFLGLPGGMDGLVTALVDRLAAAGTEVRTGAPVRALRRDGGRWLVELDGGAVGADAVVVATPAFVAAPLLAPHAPAAAATLAGVRHASVALVAFAWPDDALSRPLDGSGFLVPRSEGRLLTAASWASSKWGHLASPGRVLVRASAGRVDDRRAEAMDDDELVARLRLELAEAMGVRGDPLEVRVTRWPDAFPQYAPGHLARIAEVEADLGRLGGIALAGAALRGVGIPACIGSGRTAARALVATA